MKNILCMLFCACLLLVLTACGEKMEESINSKSNAGSTTVAVVNVNEKYYPKFMNIQNGKEAVKPLIFGSIGWSLAVRNNFLFAVQGRYVMRYNIIENKVDKIVSLGESYNGLPFGTSFASNGRHLIEYSFDFGGEGSYNYFLVDFEEEKAELLADVYDKSKVEDIKSNKIPNDLKDEFENLRFNFTPNDIGIGIIVTHNSRETDYNLSDKSERLKEVKVFRNNALGQGSYVIIDESRIGAIMPVKPEFSGELGYYKFVVIDAASDKITQEYAINIK